ncbi:MAG: YadA-like family protein [Methyloligella sp. ZOD6]
MGRGASAAGIDSIAIGPESVASGADSIAVGSGADGDADNTIAVGTNAVANEVNDIALGTDAVATGNANGSALAIGAGNVASGAGAVAIGDPSTATGDGAIAQGLDSTATGDGTVALGNAAMAGGGGQGVGVPGTAAQGAVSIGYQTEAVGQGSVALGNASTAQAAGSLAFGNGANAAVGDGVALGSGSVASRAAGVAGYVPTGADVGAIVATQGTLGAVSVGDAGNGEFRQITGVAAGTEDSDAANVAQLRAVDETANAGWDISADGANQTNVGPGDTVDLNNTDGNIVVSKASTSNDVTFDLADDISVTSLTAGNSILSNGGLTIADGTNTTTVGADGVTISGGPSVTSAGIDGGGNQIANVAAGTAATDAVNFGQLEALGDTPMTFAGNVGSADRLLGETLTIQGAASRPGTYSGANLSTTVDSAGVVNLEMTDQPQFGDVIINDAGSGRIAGVAAGVNDTDAVNVSQLTALGNSTADALGGGSSYDPVAQTMIADLSVQGTSFNNVQDALDAVSARASAGFDISAQGANASNVAPGDSVDLNNADGNIVVSKGSTSNDVTFDLADDISVTSLTAGNSVLSNGGLTVANGTNTTIVGADGVTISGGPSVTSAGIDGGGNQIANVAAGTAATDAVNVSQLNLAQDQINQNTSDIIDLDGTITDIAGDTSDTYVDLNGQGIRYARTNETGLPEADAYAQGEGSTAVGYNATSSATDGLALGRDSLVSVDTGVAIGSGSVSNRPVIGEQGTLAGGLVEFDTTDANLLGAVSLGNEDDGTLRQVTNLADGTRDHDAVTLRQLANSISAVSASSTRYFHANPGDPLNEDPDSVAAGDRSIAVGPNTVVNGDNGIGIGNGAIVNQDAAGGIAIGHNAEISGSESLAFGSNSITNAGEAIAIGAGASAQHVASLAIGSNALTSVGAQTDYAGYGLDAPQTSVGEVSFGRDGEERQLTNVAAGSADTDAVNVSQLRAVDESLDDLADRTVVYDGAPGDPKDTITLASSTGTTITNLAAGEVSGASTDAINGSQLYGLSQSIADNLGGGSTVNPDGTISNPIYNIQGNQYTNVGAGFEAIDQSITNINDQLTDINQGGGITYFRANSSLADASANGTDSVAIGPESVANGDSSLAAGHGAAAGSEGAVALGQGAQANNANDVALGSGSVTSEAVGTSGTTINGNNYDFAGATPTGTVSVGDAGSERTITNVGAGRVSADSTDAVNGSQLHSTNTALESLADQIDNVGGAVENVVQYDTNPDGSRSNSITLQGGDPNAAVEIRNVGRGVRDTDAVNVAQLNDGIDGANKYTDERVTYAIDTANSYTDEVAATTLSEANAYTDQRFNQLNEELGGIQREARQAAAIGIAAASLRYDDRPGKLSVAAGGGLWRSEGAFAFGAGYTSENGRLRANLSGTTAGDDWGVGAGASFTLN